MTDATPYRVRLYIVWERDPRPEGYGDEEWHQASIPLPKDDAIEFSGLCDGFCRILPDRATVAT